MIRKRREGGSGGEEGRGGGRRRRSSYSFACTSRSCNQREVPPPSCRTASRGSAPTTYQRGSCDQCCTALIKATLSPIFTSLAIVTDCLIVKVTLHPPPMPPSPSPPLFLLDTSKSPPKYPQHQSAQRQTNAQASQGLPYRGVQLLLLQRVPLFVGPFQ